MQLVSRKPFDFTYTPSRGPSRGECQRHGKEIISMLGRGSYNAPNGQTINIAESVRASVEETIEYGPESKIALPIPSTSSPRFDTRVSVVNGTSLASGREIARRCKGVNPFILNFASAKNPGGGFQNGARAQEESLARCSALYACIEGREMYRIHRGLSDCIYTNAMIWSPDVIVVRDDESGDLLDEPWYASFLTAPAPNAKVVLDRDSSRKEEVTRVMCERVTRSLAVAAEHGSTHLILGAWGCGVFGNDPTIVADAYHRDLFGENSPFKGIFEEVVFAVLDWSEDRHFIRPFADRFAAS